MTYQPAAALSSASKDGWPLLVGIGHSYVAGTAGNDSAITTYLRIQDRFKFATYSNQGVGSTMWPQFWGRAWGTIAPLAQPFGLRAVYVCESPLNDMTQTATTLAKRLLGHLNATKAFCALASAAHRLPVTAPQFQFAGTWTTFTDQYSSGGSCKQTTVNGSSCSVTWYGDAITLTLHGIDGAGATCSVTVGGVAVTGSPFSLTDQMSTVAGGGPSLSYVGYPIMLSGYGPGLHVAVVTKTDATANPLRVDAAIIPANPAAAPNIVLQKCVPPTIVGFSGGYTSTVDGQRAQYNAQVDQVAALFPNVAVADAQADWAAAGGAARCISLADNVHPNSYGYEILANAVERALNTLPSTWGSVLSYRVPGNPSTPNTTANAGAPSSGTLTGGGISVPTLAASTFAYKAYDLSFEGITRAPNNANAGVDFGAAGTATPTSAFCVEARFALASVTGGGMIVGRYSSDTTAGGANFGVYNANTQIVGQWRDAGGTVRQIVGNPPLATATNYEVCLDFDGTTMRLWLSTNLGLAVLIGSMATTLEVPDTTTHLIVGCSNKAVSDLPFAGTVAGIRESKVSRRTAAYTPANAQYADDANVLVLAPLDLVA